MTILIIRGSVFLQFSTDYLRVVYDKLEKEINIKNRKRYVIFSSSEKNIIAVRELGGIYYGLYSVRWYEEIFFV